MPKRYQSLIEQNCNLSTPAGLITYCFKRSFRRKTVVISINEKAQVDVYAPHYTPDKVIHKFIQKKAQWIIEKQRQAIQSIQYVNQKEYDNGFSFLFLGKKYFLQVMEEDILSSQVHFEEPKLSIKVPIYWENERKKQEIKQQLFYWYHTQAQEILGTRTFHYARIMNLEPAKIVIKKQKNLWGSCHHSRKVIHLNWKIIMSPMEVIDYVIVHELAHLKVPNHSKRFWEVVYNTLPNYRNQRKWLKINRLEMELPR